MNLIWKAEQHSVPTKGDGGYEIFGNVVANIHTLLSQAGSLQHLIANWSRLPRRTAEFVGKQNRLEISVKIEGCPFPPLFILTSVAQKGETGLSSKLFQKLRNPLPWREKWPVLPVSLLKPGDIDITKVQPCNGAVDYVPHATQTLIEQRHRVRNERCPVGRLQLISGGGEPSCDELPLRIKRIIHVKNNKKLSVRHVCHQSKVNTD